jgi:hypothetical protein
MTLHQTYQKCDNILSVSANEQVRKSKKHQTQQICIFGFHTHTQAGGGKEGGNKDSQPQPTTGKQKDKTTKAENRQGSTQHAGRTKEGKRGGMQKSNRRKAKQATKQNHSSEKTEAGRHRGGTNTLPRSGQGERGLQQVTICQNPKSQVTLESDSY